VVVAIRTCCCFRSACANATSSMATSSIVDARGGVQNTLILNDYSECNEFNGNFEHS
jgi:hypothetical protein